MAGGESLHFDERLERPATEEEREYVTRMLGNYGLYDASLDEYNTKYHQDEQWVIGG